MFVFAHTVVEQIGTTDFFANITHESAGQGSAADGQNTRCMPDVLSQAAFDMRCQCIVFALRFSMQTLKFLYRAFTYCVRGQVKGAKRNHLQSLDSTV